MPPRKFQPDDDPALRVRLRRLAPLNPRRRLGFTWALVCGDGEAIFFATRERALRLVHNERLTLTHSHPTDAD